jgi:hypothetical protein
MVNEDKLRELKELKRQVRHLRKEIGFYEENAFDYLKEGNRKEFERCNKEAERLEAQRKIMIQEIYKMQKQGIGC